MKKLLTILLTALFVCTMSIGFTACAGNQSKVKLINIALTSEKYAFALKGDNTALQTSFNAYLAEIEENGTMETIMAKYFENKGEKVGYSFLGNAEGTDVEGATIGEGKLVVATNAPFSPFEYVENGLMYGVDMEIAAGYAEKNNLQLIIKNIDFDAILPALDAGYADIGMAGMSVTEDRAAYLFTTEYYNASINLIVAADNTDFDNCKTAEDVKNVLKSLTGKKIGFQNGTTSSDYVGEYNNIEAVGYDTAAMATYDIVNGNIYAVACDNAPAAAIVESYSKQ